MTAKPTTAEVAARTIRSVQACGTTRRTRPERFTAAEIVARYGIPGHIDMDELLDAMERAGLIRHDGHYQDGHWVREGDGWTWTAWQGGGISGYPGVKPAEYWVGVRQMAEGWH